MIIDMLRYYGEQSPKHLLKEVQQLDFIKKFVPFYLNIRDVDTIEYSTDILCQCVPVFSGQILRTSLFDWMVRCLKNPRIHSRLLRSILKLCSSFCRRVDPPVEWGITKKLVHMNDVFSGKT